MNMQMINVMNIQIHKSHEYADQLAKDAAKEAKDKEKEDLPALVTVEDAKTAAWEFGNKEKWQEMWEQSERGRHVYITGKK